MKKIKVLIAHPGKQHSYRLASALANDNRFNVNYSTTVYYNIESRKMKLLAKFLPDKIKPLLLSRNNLDLNYNQVITFYPLGGLIEILLARLGFNRAYRKWHSMVTFLFGKKIGKYAIKNNYDILICYDTNSAEAFSEIKKTNSNIICILDAAAANRTYMKNVYLNDIENNELFSEKLYSETHYILDKNNQKYFENETKYADYILVASTFVANTYKYAEVDEDKILIAPYGVDLDKFNYYPRVDMSNYETIKFVYVGGTKQIKGISYLLAAFEKIKDENIHLTVVGSYNLSEEFKEKLHGKVTFTGFISHDRLPQLLNKMDVFIFPSLGDGMGLSVIEALASGLPVICTENTGAKDLIVEGENGFIIPIQNTEAILDKVYWFVNNKDKLSGMSSKARETALEYSWKKYNKLVTSSIYSAFKKSI